jgi:hypothetical protein
MTTKNVDDCVDFKSHISGSSTPFADVLNKGSLEMYKLA